MRSRSVLTLALPLFAALIWFLATGSMAQEGDGGRPPMLTPYPAASPEPTQLPAKSEPVPGDKTESAAFPPVSLFGMNLYLTGLERSVNQSNELGALAAQGGVKWSREELSWANIEPNAKGQFNWGPYDQRLAVDAANGIQVIGMLLTTPRWASTNPNAGDYFWYRPSNYNDYYDFVRAAVARWKGQIKVWELWNEPNHQATWNCLNNCNRAAEYARLLERGYAAVKAEDPGARVLIGGLYIHDRNNEGLPFLDQVVSASSGAINFDGLSIHTYMPDREPESMRPDSVVQNYQYRLNLAAEWIAAHGNRPGEIWVTEDGRSTCTTCPSSVRWSEDEQASMLARMYGISAATPLVAQLDWFQFDDKFHNATNTDPGDMYGNMSIVRNDFSPKPAYHAYRTAQQMIDGATFAGPGPQMVPGNNPHQPDTSDFVGLDYRFTRGTTSINMVWRVGGSVTVSYPVDSAQVEVVDRDGATRQVDASNGHIQLTIGPRPQYIVSAGCEAQFSDVCPDYWAYTYVEFMADRGIISGYADGTFKPGNNATRAQLTKMITLARGWTLVNPGTPSFRDVPTSNPFYQFIETAKAHDVISGYSCGANCADFRPNNFVTRGQISKILVTAFEWKLDTAGGPHFSDVTPSNPFYGFIETAFNREIISGYADRTFRPGNNATRAQLAKMIYEAMNQ